MPIIEWNSGFLIGIHEIDKHHQHLVALLNQVYDGHKRGISQYILHSIIVELSDYATYHFNCEEQWMKDTSYPDFEEHKKEHDIFKCRIIEFQKDFKLNRSTSLEVISFLTNWITHHILKTDIKMGQFIEMQSIRKRARFISD